MKVKVIGAGLAGCEAAWQLAMRGVDVVLSDMKPSVMSPAHHSGDFCELVCSNSLKSNAVDNACGLLKEEMRLLSSLVISCADAVRVPAGGALAVDRDAFASLVTEKIRSCRNIEIEEKVTDKIDADVYTIVATGPLTHEALLGEISRLSGERMFFCDAAAPIVSRESVDFNNAYMSARYGKGGADYINCPMTKDEYEAFYEALISAQTAPLHDSDSSALRAAYFEGCMPIEAMARRGKDTIRYGPLKPKGLPDPKTGREPYAVVQLRQDNEAATMYNLVGFQTNLKFGEQRRVFSMIPALRTAEFLRYGVMHKNTYINSPALLDCRYALKSNDHIYFAGQITGVEGYVESAASGLCAGLNIGAREATVFPDTTCIGALAKYISSPPPHGNFQPMNANFGIIAPLEMRVRNKRERYASIAKRALEHIKEYKAYKECKKI
ncbi:MAG: methylenetetrahydrofolate--tRNA-(uracil(54)-C(5))-methyltransferase (FADH(2)-oxidizing) TrmFO [Clostridia bacterium]|nr:methylenetetrahydrofolate--tRNA-(uracil(54)-C(5))-methyltransferase (FADH(2)-oxidizing) TrmFO [Clostridia bacterium]